jgi:enamine deaminase RidA (YjgF/YER057c/UK114 family)
MTRKYCIFAALLIVVSALPCLAEDGIRFFNPDGLFKPGTFSQITPIEGDRVVFIGGPTAREEKAQLVGVGDVRKQTAKAIENLRVAVETVGSSTTVLD